MSYEKVMQAKKYRVGLKETIKAVKRGQVREVILAQDTDQHVQIQIVNACLHHQVPTAYVDSMKELGKACGIDVGTASVAIEM